jgi:hypothetical protein
MYMLSRPICLAGLFTLFLATACFAQLQRYPLTRAESLEREKSVKTARTRATLLKLPFFDDFSVAAKVPHDTLWLNSGVRVNNQFALNAPSKGVATFDGLRANGQPWNFDQVVIQAPVDTLTSHPIDLSGLSAGSNVVLSFFWQAGGLAEAPDPTDSLLVQFKNAAGEWRTVRTITDTTTQIEDFRYEAIAVTEADLFHAGFQFRFQAYGRPAGMYDIWNIDYVYMGTGRNTSPPSIRDLTVSRQPGSVLRQYTAMPWEQFNVNPALEGGGADSTVVNNLENNFNFYEYTYTVTDLTSGSALYTFKPSVAEQIGANQRKPVGVSLPNTIIPQVSGPRVLQSKFAITTPATPVIPGVDLRRNDTVSHITVLGDYYAYDDGTAEYALGVRQRQGRVAVRYVLNKPSQLTAIRLYFTRLERNLAGQTFVLSVWKKLDNDRASVLYQRSVAVNYTDTLDRFYTYPLVDDGNNPVTVSVADTFYVGWQQTTTDLLTVGLDVNTNTQSQVFYNITGGGEWASNADVSGSVMIRPVFGPLTTAIEDEPEALPGGGTATFRVYPNPTSGRVSWSIPSVTSVQVIDMLGKAIDTRRYLPSDEPVLDLAGLPGGLYVLHLQTARKNYVRKILLRK